jgi:hypothetical protein
MLVCVDTVGDGTSLQIKLQTDLFITICVKAECVSAIAGGVSVLLSAGIGLTVTVTF